MRTRDVSVDALVRCTRTEFVNEQSPEQQTSSLARSRCAPQLETQWLDRDSATRDHDRAANAIVRSRAVTIHFIGAHRDRMRSLTVAAGSIAMCRRSPGDGNRAETLAQSRSTTRAHTAECRDGVSLRAKPRRFGQFISRLILLNKTTPITRSGPRTFSTPRSKG